MGSRRSKSSAQQKQITRPSRSSSRERSRRKSRAQQAEIGVEEADPGTVQANPEPTSTEEQ
jgi:hypothetical protein